MTGDQELRFECLKLARIEAAAFMTSEQIVERARLFYEFAHLGTPPSPAVLGMSGGILAFAEPRPLILIRNKDQIGGKGEILGFNFEFTKQFALCTNVEDGRRLLFESNVSCEFDWNLAAEQPTP